MIKVWKDGRECQVKRQTKSTLLIILGRVLTGQKLMPESHAARTISK